MVAIADGLGIPRDSAFALGLLVHLVILATTSIGGGHRAVASRRREAARRADRDGGAMPRPHGGLALDARRLAGASRTSSSRCTLRHRTLRSRITFGAHTANMAEGGLPGERHIGYYRERALGGAGMIVVEPVPIHRTGVLTRGNFRHDDDAIIPAFRRVTDACREANPDVVLIHQLYHVGQHGDADNSFAPNWSPSGLPSYHDADGSHAMTTGEIEELIDGFVAAAGRAQASGFDGVEVFAAYHAVVDQFWAPWSNRRTDEWGGSFEDRMRFSSEILRRIRERCGEDFIVGLAVSADPGSPAMPSVEELAEIVAWHDERRLMDYVTCGTGSYFDFHQIIPPSLYEQRLGEPFAAALKGVVRHALVQAESHIRTPEAAEAVLAAGHADMVSIVRGQIADPHLVAKARAGRADEVRPCISCNQLCWGRRSRDYWISCLVNPSAGREWEWGGDRFEPAGDAASGAGRRRRAGRARGGPGRRGARARGDARWSAATRSAVSSGSPGCQPSRGQITDLLAWFGRRLGALGVDVRLGVEADADEVVARRRGRGHRRDRLAAGAGRVPARAAAASTGSPGWTARTSSRSTTCWTARPTLGPPRPRPRRPRRLARPRDGAPPRRGRPRRDDRDRGAGRRRRPLPQRRRRPAARAVRAGGRPVDHLGLPSSGWRDGSATVRSTRDRARSRELEADTLVIAETPRRRDRTWPTRCRARGIAFHQIGDCVAPRRASLAFYEGRELALRL